MSRTEPLLYRLEAVRRLADELFRTHGLHGWTLVLNRRKREMGLCDFDRQTIALSVYFISLNNDEAIQDTLLHEIAHALVGPGHGHDQAWKQTCIAIGARPQRLSFEAVMPAGSWQAVCGACGMIHHKHRRPKRAVGWYCRFCGPVQGQLTWKPAC